MRKSLIALTIPGILLLQACSTYYVAPTGPDLAVLTIKNNTNQPLGFITYEKAADCSGRIFMSPDYTGIPVAGELSIKVKPSEPLSFYMGYTSKGRRGGWVTGGVWVDYCDVTSTFTPEPNGQYTVRFSLDDSKKKCFYPMAVKNEFGEARESSYKKREALNPLFQVGAHCK